MGGHTYCGSQDNPVAKAVRKVRNDGQVIKQWSPTLLRMELDKWLWKDEKHISLKRVWECLATYLYLSRLSSSDALLDAVREGIRTGEFGYANSVQDDGKYAGLQFDDVTGSIYLDDQSMLVKPDVAAKQLEAEAGDTSSTTDEDTSDSGIGETGEDYGDESGGTDEDTNTSPQRPRRFYGSVDLNPVRASRDAQNVINEVVQHLTGLSNSNVKVTIDIEATFGDGVPEDLERILTENCHTLRFTSQEFEDE